MGERWPRRSRGIGERRGRDGRGVRLADLSRGEGTQRAQLERDGEEDVVRQVRRAAPRARLHRVGDEGEARPHGEGAAQLPRAARRPLPHQRLRDLQPPAHTLAARAASAPRSPRGAARPRVRLRADAAARRLRERPAAAAAVAPAPLTTPRPFSGGIAAAAAGGAPPRAEQPLDGLRERDHRRACERVGGEATLLPSLGRAAPPVSAERVVLRADVAVEDSQDERDMPQVCERAREAQQRQLRLAPAARIVGALAPEASRRAAHRAAHHGAPRPRLAGHGGP